VKVIGCGHPDRGDDAAGVLVARRLREWGIETRDATALLEAWAPDDVVIVVDATVTGERPGTVRVWDGKELPASMPCRTSTHGFGVAEAIGLAKALDRLPKRLQVYGIEGKRFALGDGVSPEVAGAVEVVAARIARDVRGDDVDDVSPGVAGHCPRHSKLE
jgi:hydrogenase maturation protease